MVICACGTGEKNLSPHLMGVKHMVIFVGGPAGFSIFPAENLISAFFI